ncbi:cysteine proteinases superfamily protein [Tasmannia lanceolata]|uniref:cysteine proteinases superfamily protein n=1 Tax=Tasmannia lanceolata TaxID=3420 RepID=UPI00406325DD
MAPSKGNDKILSYEDVVLWRSDLDILGGPYYLNDRIIEFYFSYLSSTYPSQDIILVPPSISFWITNCLDFESLKDVIEPLKLSDKKLAIFTVNDNDDVNEAEGGTHWSLLAYDRDTNTFIHHDSVKELNGRCARKLYKAVVGFVGDHDLASSARFVEISTPQQKNGYDCGLYVLAIAKVICHWHMDGLRKTGDHWFSSLEAQVDACAVAEMRNEILRLIQNLMMTRSEANIRAFSLETNVER